MSEKVHFTIEGEFITNMAREKFYIQKDLAGALALLRSALVSDEITPDEQLMICLQVLNGDARIKGNSGTDDYGVECRDDIDENPTQLSSIASVISGIDAEMKALKAENRELMVKLAFLAHRLGPLSLESANADYYNETGEPMFAEMEIPAWRKIENQYVECSEEGAAGGMLESFLAQKARELEAVESGGEAPEDYGWLDPQGNFYPVEWGMHAQWANDWLEEHHMLYRDRPDIYVKKNADSSIEHVLSSGDVLVYSLGWVLLDNPWQGIARATSDPSRELTKAQKEFLYGYYVERGRMEEANALYQD